MKSSNDWDARFLSAPQIYLARPADSTEASLEAPAPKLDRIRVSQDYLSADVAAQFSIGFGVGSGSATSKTRSFVLVYEAMIESAGTPVEIGQALWEEVQAIGVRVQISVTESDSAVKLDAFSVAAAVQLNLAKADYSTQVLPASAEALKAFLPPDGAFDMGSYEQILTGINAAKNALGAAASTLAAQRYYRPLGLASALEQDLVAAQTIAFGMREIAKSKYVETAMDDAGDRALDATLVRLVYDARQPGIAVHTDPDDAVIAGARAWLADPITF